MVAEASAWVVFVSARKVSGEWTAPGARPGASILTTALRLIGLHIKGERSTSACVNEYTLGSTLCYGSTLVIALP